MTALDINPSENVTPHTGDDDDPAMPIKPALQASELRFKVANAFLNMLDRARDFWEFRALDDVVLLDGSKRKESNLTCTIKGSLKEAFSKLTQLNESGAGVFVTVNRTDGRGRKAENVTGVAALFADTDGADIEALLVLRPHIAVLSSPGKFHCYWRVSDCDCSLFKELQQAIAEKYGTDTAVCDLPRVMRMPGFSHQKSEPFLVMFVPEYMNADREPYTVQEVVEGLGLQCHLSQKNGNAHPFSDASSENDPPPRPPDADCGPPPVETMRAMLRHLAAKDCFEDRNRVKETDGCITKLGWIECGMALKLAYGGAGFDLWAETHVGDRAGKDAPEQWASFADHAQPEHVTIGTIIKAACDAGFSWNGSGRIASGDPTINEKCETAFRRLATLSPIDYDRARRNEAEQLGIRVTTLDEEVARWRPKHADAEEEEEPGQGQRIRFTQIEPWPDPVDGAQLLDEIEAAYKRYVVMPTEGASAVALWAVFAHCYREFEHSPRLALQSPEPRCGKTSVLKVTEQLVPRAQRADNVSAAVLFRMIEAYSPTFLVDEADAFARENDELRGIINSGHERGGSVARTVGDDHEPRAFRTWGAMMIAGIGSLAGTIEDRSIIVKLKRKRRDEPVERFRSTRCAHLQELARKIVRWVQDHQGVFQNADPPIPDELGDRAADNWRPLLGIADEAKGSWPGQARRAAVALSSEGGSAISQSARLKLLVDIREIFATRNVVEISSSDLVEALCKLPDRPWNDWSRGKSITARRVADFLSEFSIHPRKLKTGTRPNGYEHSQFDDAFERYLGGEPPSSSVDASGLEPLTFDKPLENNNLLPNQT